MITQFVLFKTLSFYIEAVDKTIFFLSIFIHKFIYFAVWKLICSGKIPVFQEVLVLH